MLHKSFKPAKCKTALNLAKSRIKLLKNKKETQVKQLKRELAQLLESGQDQTARIRVEHVVREEKTMAAYELIEIYSELIVARLPIIESQKNCPLDLKEAITSLIFAAPRCGDIPELQDVRKHFTAKYGKEFVASAIELRPACGVSRTMVEKLSVKAPDGPTKVKILTAIAEEHNIKWEPNWFKDEDEVPSADMSKPPDLARTEKVNVIQMEPLNFEIHDDLQQRHAQNAARSATSPQNYAHDDIDAKVVPPSSTSHTDTRSGSSSERNVFSHLSGTVENVYSTGWENWNMEFKDATAAAQAAAESAERASMAARAAAELSTRSKVISDNKSGPSVSSVHQEYVERNPSNSSFNLRSLRMQGNMKQDAEARTLKEDYRESKNSYDPVQDMRRQSRDSFSTLSTSQAESNLFISSNQEEYGNEPVENPFHEETVEIKNQPSSFPSQSTAFGDEYSIFSNLNDRNPKNDSDHDGYSSFNSGIASYNDWNSDVKKGTSFEYQGEMGMFLGSDKEKHGFRSGEDVFVSMDQRNNQMDVEETVTHTDTGVVFDESGSDGDDYIFDQVQKSYDQENSSGNWNPHHGLEVSESFRNSPIYSKLSEPLPIAFDSDGEGSGSEKELQDEKTDPVVHTNAIPDQSSGLHSRSSEPVSEIQYETHSSPEAGMELNLGLLPGGRRNKPHRDPPYTRGAALGDNSASPRSPMADGPQVSRDTSGVHTHFGSTGDDSEVVTDITERPYKTKIHESPHKTSPIAPRAYFDSDDSSEEDAPKQSVTSRTLLGAGLSRRTKPSVPSSSYAKEASRWDEEAISRLRLQRRVPKEEESSSSSVAEKPVTPKGTSNSSEKAPSRENSTKNPSHVHPKLPDFESFTAHLQSLRGNRQ